MKPKGMPKELEDRVKAFLERKAASDEKEEEERELEREKLRQDYLARRQRDALKHRG
jgi:hypothetical protein